MNLYLNRAINALTAAHPLQPIWQIYLSQIQAQALNFAVETKLFATLLKASSAVQLAQQHHLHAENTKYLLQLLASLQVLDEHADQNNQTMYRIKSELIPYLDPQSDQYCGDALLFRQNVIQSVSAQLPNMFAPNFQMQIREAKNIELAWAQAAQIQIAQEQAAVTTHIVNILSDLIPEFKSAKQCLDVGAGAGLISMFLAEKFTQLDCTLLELPSVIETIRPNLNQHPAQHRLHCISSTIEDIQFDRSYDIIWCSSVLHFVGDPATTLAKLLGALSAQGVLICCHSEIDPLHHQPLVQSYYLNMRMQKNYVPKKGEIYETLKKLGCGDIQVIEDVQFPVAPLDVLIARK